MWPGANFSDRVVVGLKVTSCIRGCKRRFAEHVERIAIRNIVFLHCPFQGLFYRAPHDKLVPHDAHRLLHRRSHDGLSRTTRQLAEYLHRIFLRSIVNFQQVARQHQAPGRGIHEQ